MGWCLYHQQDLQKEPSAAPGAAAFAAKTTATTLAARGSKNSSRNGIRSTNISSSSIRSSNSSIVFFWRHSPLFSCGAFAVVLLWRHSCQCRGDIRRCFPAVAAADAGATAVVLLWPQSAQTSFALPFLCIVGAPALRHSCSGSDGNPSLSGHGHGAGNRRHASTLE